MNREDIICMAREASPKNHDRNIFFDMMVEDLERFAELVRKDYSTTHANLWLDRVHKFVLEEREACAKIAETPIGEYEVVVACGTEPTPSRIPQYANWQDIAKAIRARGQA